MCEIPELKPFELYIGTDEAKNAVVYPLDQLPHLLVCGMNGCGRSSFLRTQTALLAHGTSAEQLRLVLMDETGVEFVQFRKLPHLLMPSVYEPWQKAGAMFALRTELQRRYSLLAECGVRALADYNRQAEKPLPRIVAIVDGVEDLLAQEKCTDQIQQICQKGRSVGIHLIAAARKAPQEKIVAEFSSRIAFRTATKNAAHQIGIPGAELLLNPGTALFSPVTDANPVRVQTKELTDEEIEALIAPVATGPQYDEEFLEKAIRAVSGDECSDEPDPMYEQALQCVIKEGYASTSLLQRHCKIGYARAAHIIDQLELEKVIGPYQGAKPRELLPPYTTMHAAAAAEGAEITCNTHQETVDSEEEIVQSPTEDLLSEPWILEDDEPPLEWSHQSSAVSNYDAMEGHDFEHLCADALRANGYSNVEVTRASGDYGVDILAEKNGVPYAIQCKRYNSAVGNHAVQEAYSGAAYYGGRVPVVLTNQDFTPAAKKMADSLGVQLWGRSKLDALLRVYESPEQQIMRMLLKALKGILKFAAYIMGFLMALMFIPFWFLWPSKKRRR